MSPTVDTVVSEYEAATLAGDYPALSGIVHSLLTMMLSGEEDVAASARETAQAILIVREAHKAIEDR